MFNFLYFQVLKNPSRPTAKGNFWTVNTTTIPRDLMARQNTHVSRVVQDNGFSYRKDLTEVFDCRTGNIKVDIPLSLFKGADLIEEPAVIMERLLLEPKSDGEAMRINDGRMGKIYSLVDMFNQEDFVDGRFSPNGPQTALSWPGVADKSRNVSPQLRKAASVSPSVKVESPQTPVHPIGSLPLQNEMLARALAGQLPPTQLPLIHALYNNYLHMTGTNQPSALTDSVFPRDKLTLDSQQSSGVAMNNGIGFETPESVSDDESRKWNGEELRSSPEVSPKSTLTPEPALRTPAMYNHPSPERNDYTPPAVNEKLPRGTLKGLFTAYKAWPLEIGKI